MTCCLFVPSFITNQLVDKQSPIKSVIQLDRQNVLMSA